MPVYICKRCGHEGAKKQHVMKHVYQHVEHEKWPYRCPLPQCEWFGKYPNEYKGHVDTKMHLKATLQNPDLDDDNVEINPLMELVRDVDWVREDRERTVTKPWVEVV